jgi:hypothetical protein
MAKTLMTASIIRCKETTKHQIGHFDSSGEPVVDYDLDCPCTLSVVSVEGAIYLWRMNDTGECIADTWHMNEDEAMAQAEFEYEIAHDGWKKL